jgi:hypothetical protein
MSVTIGWFARQVVVTTLNSCGFRIGSGCVAWALLRLRDGDCSLVCFFGFLWMLAQPVLKFLVFTTRKFRCFGDDVRRGCIKELSVPVQIASDFFLQSDLKVRSFWLLRWCFQKCHVPSSSSLEVCSTACITEFMFRSVHAALSAFFPVSRFVHLILASHSLNGV